MKASRLLIAATVHLAASAFMVPGTAGAQDIVKVAPNQTKVLLENDQVRVIEVKIKAGEKVPTHSHPSYVIYSVTGGKTKSTSADGKATERDIKAGTATWNEGETHSTENVGTSDGHVILTELKAPKK